MIIGATVIAGIIAIGGTVYKKIYTKRPPKNKYGIKIKIHRPDKYHGLTGIAGMTKRWASLKGKRKTKLIKFAKHHRWRYHLHVYLTKNGKIIKTLLTL